MSKKKIGKKKPVIIKGRVEATQPNHLFLLLVIFMVTLLVYASSLSNGWTNWDDEGYVLQNDLVKSPDLKTIFSSFVMGNYHPVTVLIQATEFHFFHADASGFHSISLFIHFINALLVFYAIFLLTKKSIAAFVCSLLFAIHPLHAESVAWISAQKDLLFTGFYFTAIIFYLKFSSSRRKKIVLYIAALVAFVFSGLSKGQAVTLPVILLLIDWYLENKITGRRILEKLPFFVLSFIFGIIAIIAQKESASVQELKEHSFILQLLFACFAFTGYLIKSFLPINLSAYYPYPEKMEGSYPLYIYAAPVIIIIMAWLLFRFRKKIPPVLFGAAFFTVNIFLVLQLLPVGGAIMADRYTYLSAIGIFFPLAIFISDLWDKKISLPSNYRMLVFAATSVWVIFLCFQTRARNTIWKNSETLWTDVIKKYPRVPIAHNNLGSYYQKHNRLDLAKQQFDEALRLQPDFANALINRSDYFRTRNQLDSAVIDGNHAVRLDPLSVEARQNRGIAFCLANKLDSAKKDFQFILTQQPQNARNLNNLGNLFMMQNQFDSAMISYHCALRADPAFSDVYNNRGKCYLQLGQYQQAIADLTRGIQIDPENANNYYFRMQAYEKAGMKKEALADGTRAMSLGMEIPAEYIESLK